MLSTDNIVIKELLAKTTNAFQRGIILKFANRCDFECSSYRATSSSNVGSALLKNGEKFLSWNARTDEVKYHGEAQTKTYTEVKHEKQITVDALLATLGVFFAYSNQQFADNKTPLSEGDKYVQFANGSFVPKSNFEALEQGFDMAEKIMREQIKANHLEEDEVLYELENHECFYTGSIDDAMDVLGDDYSREFVKSVYFKNQSKYEDQNWFN